MQKDTPAPPIDHNTLSLFQFEVCCSGILSAKGLFPWPWGLLWFHHTVVACLYKWGITCFHSAKICFAAPIFIFRLVLSANAHPWIFLLIWKMVVLLQGAPKTNSSKLSRTKWQRRGQGSRSTAYKIWWLLLCVVV